MRASSASDTLQTGALPDGALAALRILFAGQWRRLALATLSFIVKHSPVWFLPIVTSDIINAINRGGSGELIRCLQDAGALVCLLLLNIPMNTLYARLLNGAIRAMEARTRMALISRLQLLSLGFHDSARSGALQNKVLRDVENVGTMVGLFINTVLSTFVGVSVAVVWTLSRKPIMSLFFLLVAPLAAAVMKVFRKPIAENTQGYRKALEGMSVRVTEMISMLPITRAHAAEDFEMSQISSAMDRVAATGRRQDVLNGLFNASSWVTFQTFSLASLLVSGVLALRGAIPIGDVILYQGFFASITAGLNAVVSALPDIAKGGNAIQSIGEVLRSDDVERFDGKRRIDSLRGAFSFRGVSFAYPGYERPALRGIDLDIEAGQTVAFVGESGSGKSTLMSLVLGFHRPSSGSIALDGIDMEELDLRDLRRRLSLVSQNVILFSGTVRDNVCYGTEGMPEEKIREALREANALNFVMELPDGLDTSLGENGSRLSGGQRQRLAIARALARDPRIIILDEATSALDVESEMQVQDAIERLAEGRTTLIVAHRLSTIRNADRVAVLKQGRLVEFGSHDELLGKDGEFQETLCPLPLGAPS